MHTRYSLLSSLLLFSAVAIHSYIVFSIISDKKPIIWPLHSDTIYRAGKAADFFGVYHAGECITYPKPFTLYHCPYALKVPYFYSFRYLPVVAFILYPLQTLNPWVAYVLWVALVELALLLSVILLSHIIEEPRTRTMAAVILLLSTPYFLELYMGQFTFITAAIYLIGISLGAAWVAVPVATMLKIFPAATLPAWIKHKWGLPLVFICIDAAILTNIPYFLSRPNSIGEMYYANLYIADRDSMYSSGNYSLASAIGLSLEALKFEDTIKPALIGLRYGTLLLSILVALFSRQQNSLAQFGLLLLAHFVAYHHVWEHHYSAVILIGVYMLTLPQGSRYTKALILTALVLLALPTPFALIDVEKSPKVWDPTLGWALWKKYAILLPKVIPLLMLYGVALWYNLKDGPLSLSELWRQIRQAQALP